MSKTLIVITQHHPLYCGTSNDWPMIEVFRDGKFTGTSITFTGTGYGGAYYKTHEYVLQQAKDMSAEYSNPEIVDLWNPELITYDLAKVIWKNA